MSLGTAATCMLVQRLIYDAVSAFADLLHLLVLCQQRADDHSRTQMRACRAKCTSGGSWDGSEGGGGVWYGRTRSMIDCQVEAFPQSQSPKLYSNTQPPQHGKRQFFTSYVAAQSAIVDLLCLRALKSRNLR